MKQKTRFKNFGNIGYRPMHGRYIGIVAKNAISPRQNFFLLECV